MKNPPTGGDNLLPLGVKVAQVISELNAKCKYCVSRRAQRRLEPT